MIRKVSNGFWYIGSRNGNGAFCGRLDASMFVALSVRFGCTWYVAIGLPWTVGWSVAPPFKHFSLGLIAFGRGHA